MINTVSFEDKAIWAVSIRAADGRTETIHATGNHPFWVEVINGDKATGGWTAVELLKSGDQLRLADGSPAFVEVVVCTDITTQVFNFEVEGYHTYHVGKLGVWVHNTNCGENFLIGKAREALARIDLQKLYPDAQILSQRTLRRADQTPAIDPFLKEGRRLDFVVVKNGKAIDVVEVTGTKVDKRAQLLKEDRIHQLGEVFIRLPGTRTLIEITGQISRVDRRL